MFLQDPKNTKKKVFKTNKINYNNNKITKNNKY